LFETVCSSQANPPILADERSDFQMPCFHFSSRLKLTIVSIFIAMGCSACFAQGPEKPDAPTPQGAPAQGTKPISPYAPHEMISGKERVRWVIQGTLGPKSLIVGVFSAGISTADNTPREYGPHWDGFAKRYGMRLTGVATSNTMEAGLGAIWGEDPRYVRSADPAFKKRLGHVFLLTFTALNREGELKPAYARYIAIPGSNFLSNTWRADSVSNSNHALTRTAYGFLFKLASRAWTEFWPDIKQKVSKK
jgi:hypothetical protein